MKRFCCLTFILLASLLSLDVLHAASSFSGSSDDVQDSKTQVRLSPATITLISKVKQYKRGDIHVARKEVYALLSKAIEHNLTHDVQEIVGNDEACSYLQSYEINPYGGLSVEHVHPLADALSMAIKKNSLYFVKILLSSIKQLCFADLKISLEGAVKHGGNLEIVEFLFEAFENVLHDLGINRDYMQHFFLDLLEQAVEKDVKSFLQKKLDEPDERSKKQSNKRTTSSLGCLLQ